MTTAATPLVIVQRHTTALLTPLAAALEGDAAALHRARVASRRLRELLPLVALPDKRARKLRKRVRRLTQLLGRVREMDVSLALLEASLDGLSHHEALEARQHLAATREARRARMLHKLHKVKVKKIARHLDELVEAAAVQDVAAWRRVLATRLSRRAKVLQRATVEAGPIYVPERLHAVRIASKKLRYALELAAELGAASAARLASTARKAQVTLGALQDRHVLMRHVAEVATQARNGDEAARRPGGLLILSERLEGAGRELHGQFLAQRDALGEAALAVRHHVVPELLRHTRKAAHADLDTRRSGPARIRQAG